MASCPKCNHRPLKKHPDGTRRCPRHGVVTPNTFVAVGLVCLALASCAPMLTKHANLDMSKVQYTRDRNGNCFAVLTYHGYGTDGVIMATVPCERTK